MARGRYAPRTITAQGGMSAPRWGTAPIGCCSRILRTSRLTSLLAGNLPAECGYLLQKAFQFLWIYRSPNVGGRFLARWFTPEVRAHSFPRVQVYARPADVRRAAPLRRKTVPPDGSDRRSVAGVKDNRGGCRHVGERESCESVRLSRY
jgi:hypothetical protein